MKNCALIFILFLVLSFPAFSQTLDDLVIDANTVFFDETANKFDAQGSVEAHYKNLSLFTQHLVYQTKTKEILVDTPFKMNRQGLTFEGSSLRYRLDTDSGVANNVEIQTSGIFLIGRELKVAGETFDFRNASFTTCDIEKGDNFNAHYKVSATQIVFYPEVGWLVAYLGFFSIGNVPLVPIPTYIYDLKAEEKGRQNAPPFPDIGSNDEDGTFIQEKIIWSQSRKWNGYFSFDYASKKGFGGGVWGNYLINNERFGSIRLSGNSVDQWSGGLTYIYDPDIEDPKACLPDRQLQLDLTIRERINYQRISYTPKIAWRGKKRELGEIKGLSGDLEISAAKIKEESSFISLGEGNLQSGLKYEIPMGDFGNFVPEMRGNWHWYSNNQAWQKINYTLSYNKSFSLFDFTAYNLHYLDTFGGSPFVFENYRFIARDEIGGSLFYNFFASRLGFQANYYLPDLSVKDMDYVFSAGFHCYAIIISYRAMRNEFSFGFSLLPGKTGK